MTADEPTRASGHERTDTDEHDDRHLFEDELPAGHVTAEAFFAPEPAAVTVRPKSDRHVALLLREGTNERGLKTTWLLTPADARDVADRLDEAAAEVEETDE